VPDIKVLPDKNGGPRRIEVNIFMRQPHPAPGGQINDFCRTQLRGAAQQIIDTMNSNPFATQTITLFDVQLQGIAGEDSTTHVNPITNESHWQLTGLAFGIALVTLS
jgi:hypothetical protein